MSGWTTKQKQIKKIKPFKKRPVWVAFVPALLACMLIMMWYIAPIGRNFNVGDTASRDLIAPYDVIDKQATEKLQAAAKLTVQDVYLRDETMTREYEKKAMKIFDYLDRLPEDARKMGGQIIDASARNSLLREYDYRLDSLTSDEWAQLLGENGSNRLRQPIEEYLSETELYAMLSMPRAQYREWIRELSIAYDKLLRQGIQESSIEVSRDSFLKDLKPFTPIYLDGILDQIATHLILPNMFYSADATKAVVDTISRNTATQYIIAGEPIVKKGMSITTDQHDILKEIGYISSPQEMFGQWGAIILFYLVLGIPILSILSMIARKQNITFRCCLLFSIIISSTLLLSLLMQEWNIGFHTIFFCMLLLTQLLSPSVSLMGMLLLMPTVSVMSGGIGVFDYSLVMQSMLVTLVSGLVGIALVRFSKRRSTLIFAGLCSGISCSVVYLMIGMMKGNTLWSIGTASFWAILGGMFGAILGIGLLPLLESIFDIATPTRLLELCDPNSPLLQRLMIEAPGTYHHSIMVANLSEACASAAGANVSLIRVAAYYHDIGKLENPLYFSENQYGENLHDAMDPWQSAAIIRAHVTDGVSILKNEKFPSAVIDIVSEYHGTRVMGAFYGKAVLESKDPNLSDMEFRYSGPTPRSMESAILMVVDSLEAAVRAMRLVDPDEISKMLDKIVSAVFEDNQLKDSPLSFEQVEKMRRCILRVFHGETHKRVQYPDISALKKELNG